MSAREFERWRIYYRIAPFGDDWPQASLIAAASLQPFSKSTLAADRFIPRAADRSDAALEAKFAAFERRHNRGVRAN